MNKINLLMVSFIATLAIKYIFSTISFFEKFNGDLLWIVSMLLGSLLAIQYTKKTKNRTGKNRQNE